MDKNIDITLKVWRQRSPKDKGVFETCWQYQGEDKAPVMLKEELDYEFIVRQQRNYKS